MFWLDNSSGVTDMPEIPAKLNPVAQWFTEGGNGKAPAYPGAHWYNIVQAELLNVLAAAEVEPDKTKLDQLLTAINILIKNKTDEIGGYLAIAKLLSEIKDKGEAAQKTSRENIGIDGDIAYRDKVNAFTKENTFSAETTFNKITHSKDTKHYFDTQKTGVSVANGLVWRESDQTTFVEKAHIHPESDSLDIYSAKTHLRLKTISLNGVVVNVNGTDYISYHSGNLKPVLSVNNTGPDAKGNVNVQGENVDLSDYYTKEDVNALLKPADVGAVGSYALLVITGDSLYQWSINNGYLNTNNPPPTKAGDTITGTIFQTARITVGGDGTSTTNIVSTGAVSGNWMLLGSLADSLSDIDRFRRLCVLAVRVS
ncbi:hypothetical protein GUQ72_000699 [Salmonella enterica subsp. enterica]|nr:hypothetical protein [Salmonella enterica subsp. enterica serovar Tudu]